MTNNSTSRAVNSALIALIQAQIAIDSRALQQRLDLDGNRMIVAIDETAALFRVIGRPKALPAGDAPDVWFDDVAPGGYGCGGLMADGKMCGVPTESEPCPTHQPNAYAAIN
jgi:hypothetical protein